MIPTSILSNNIIAYECKLEIKVNKKNQPKETCLDVGTTICLLSPRVASSRPFYSLIALR